MVSAAGAGENCRLNAYREIKSARNRLNPVRAKISAFYTEQREFID